ncbi:MAG: hypothetical protein KF857_02490 [Fimbriimonadaceae bacterium]|nr:hypothetical protein [Fimbriimonadaceae bacterium]
MKLPPAIDAAMWELAESNDQAALDAFVARYPEYMQELTQRVRMVRGLKGLKPANKAKERFVPVSDPLPMPTTNRWAVPVAATLVLGSLVFATVSVTRWMDAQNRAKEVVTHQNPPLQVMPPKDKAPVVGQAEVVPKNGGTGPVQDPVPPQPERPKTPWDVPVTISSDRTTLMAALQAVAAQAGISLEFGPGMPDIDIQADYRQQPAKLVMQDMGKNFGFTVLQQTQNTGLVIPAVDPNAHPMDNAVGNSAVARELRPDAGQAP